MNLCFLEWKETICKIPVNAQIVSIDKILTRMCAMQPVYDI